MAEALAQNSVQVSYCKFEMKATLHGREYSKENLRDEALRLNLGKRKNVLTMEIDHMTSELSSRKIELDNIQKTLDEQDGADCP